jgi:ATP-dependent Lhr-like helicase
MQRWQHLDERDQLEGPAGTAAAVRQLYGIARPAGAWDRDYLRSRVKSYDPTWLAQHSATGEPVWTCDGNYHP